MYLSSSCSPTFFLFQSKHSLLSANFSLHEVQPPAFWHQTFLHPPSLKELRQKKQHHRIPSFSLSLSFLFKLAISTCSFLSNSNVFYVKCVINQDLIVSAKIELLMCPHWHDDDILNSSQIVNTTLSVSLVTCNLMLSIVSDIFHMYTTVRV